MSYVTEAQMIDRFGEDELIQLTDRDELGAIDSTVLGAAISDATEEVDSYLGGRYDVPLQAPLPGLIVRLTADIARFNLHEDQVTDVVEKAYDRALTILDRIQKGTMLIPGVSTSATMANSSPVGSKTDADRVFTMSTLENF